MEEIDRIPPLKKYPAKSETSPSKAMCSEVASGDGQSIEVLQHSAGSFLAGDETSLAFLCDLYKLAGASGTIPLLSFPTLGNGTVATTVASTVPKDPPTPPPLPSAERSQSSPPSQPTDGSPHSACDFPVGSQQSPSADLCENRSLAQMTARTPDTTVFHSRERYHHYLEAPTSMITVRGEDSITYLNKGQFYTVSFEANLDEMPPRNPITRVRSDLFLVFREEKDARSELQHWEYWHSQQANPNQRALDVDRKAFKNILSFEDRAFNTYSFFWNPNEMAKVAIRLNCLSTEFTLQKGVKGIPLYLQIDTFEDLTSADPEPVHRCYCKVKVFRDKGAERKNKDESKTADRRMARILKANQSARKRHRESAVSAFPSASPILGHISDSALSPADPSSPAGFFVPPSKVTRLLPTSTLGRKPVPFIPAMATNPSSLFNNQAQSELLLAMIKDREAKRTFPTTLMHASDQLDDLDVGNTPKLKPPCVPQCAPAVMVYVRKEEEKVYNAIMMDDLTVQALSELIGHKYGVPGNMIKHVYKRTRRGILVNMDDRMVEQFSNEDDFIIQLEFDNQLGYFELFLSY